MASEAKLKANEKYLKANTKIVSLRLNYNTDKTSSRN